MDEKAMRAHFERAAGAEPPPSTVDVARARKAGRRRLRIRRAGVPAVSVGIVTAVGALFASGVLPVGATSNRAPVTTHSNSPEHARGLVAPASFDPLAIWATFGWLPRGFSAVAPSYPETTNQSSLDAMGSSKGQDISLMVFAARQCELTGPFWSPPKGGSQSGPASAPVSAGTSRSQQTPLSPKRYPAGLRCNWGPTPWLPQPVVRAGHLTGGEPAYRMLGRNGQPDGLAWQYARGGWATIGMSTGARPAELRRVAANVRYRSNLRLPFPFRLVGTPASWRLSAAGLQETRGELTGYALYLGPSQDPAGMSVLVEPSFPNACSFTAGQSHSVSFDGARGVLVTTNVNGPAGPGGQAGGEHQQDACFPNLHGMQVWVSVSLPDKVGGAMGLLHHVQVLGPDPANWTTQPLG